MTSAEARLPPPSLWEPGERRYHSDGPTGTCPGYKERAGSPGRSWGAPGVARFPRTWWARGRLPRFPLRQRRAWRSLNPLQILFGKAFASAWPRERLAGPGCLAACGLQPGKEDKALTSRPRPPAPGSLEETGTPKLTVLVLEAFPPSHWATPLVNISP